MAKDLFISYSPVDAKEFTARLCDRLMADTPSYSTWLDRRELKSGFDDWDEQILEGIRGCEALLFVMTSDSVSSGSVCKKEWSQALKFKKPIVLLKLHANIEIPFQLENRQFIDFSEEFEIGLSKLRINLQWLKSPEGKLQDMKTRLGRAERDLPRTDDPVQQARIQDEIKSLKKQITDKEKIINDPEGEEKRVQESIATGIERERHPKKPISGVSKTKFINPPPGVAPTYWQNRYYETKLVGQFLENDVERLMTVVGRAGVGKTAMVCRLLKSLESGRLPENGQGQPGGKELKVDGIVYLSERGSRKVTFPDLYFDLCRLLSNEIAQDLDEIYKDASTSTAGKMNALLRAFPKGRFVVLLDNFEDKVNTETLKIDDEEIKDALTTLLTSELHAVKVIVTTRVAPRGLALTEPSKQRRLDLDEGLDSPFAENILREMDIDGKVGLKEASDAVLDEARKRTNGYPRALEALFAILSADRETSLSEILADTQELLPDHVVKKMVGEAYNRLDADAQMVMQALAIYGRPISNVAVDYLLQPHMAGVNSSIVLNRLVHMHFARKEGTRYYLHPVDRDYALDRIPEGEPGDRLAAESSAENKPEVQSIFSQYALLNRGAQFFRETRLPREKWKTLDDLAPQLAEFELRCQSKDYDTAVSVLLEIDFDYLMLWGHSRLVVEYHLRLLGNIEDDSLKINSLNCLGSCYYSLDNYQKAIEHYQKSLDIARESGHPQGEGALLGNLGICYYSLGNYQKAIEHHQKSLQFAQKNGDRQGEGTTLGNLGICYDSLGNYQKAIEHHQQHLDIAREIDDRQAEGNSLGNLGNCYYSLGDYQKAIEHHLQHLDIAREIGHRQGEGNSLGNLGNCYYSLGDYQKAIEHHQKSLDIAREIGHRQGEGNSLGNLGNCYYSLGDYQQAIEHHLQHLDIAREIGHRQGEGNSIGNLGNCYSSLGNYQKAIEHHLQHLDITMEIRDRQGEGNSLNNLGSCYSSLGNYQKAIEHHQQSLDIAQEIDSPHVLDVYSLLGIALLKLGQYHEGKTNLEKAVIQADIFLQQAEGVEIIDFKALALCGLAICEQKSTYADKAREAFKKARAITKAKGQVDYILTFFDQIAELDEKSLLAGVREVAAGTKKVS